LYKIINCEASKLSKEDIKKCKSLSYRNDGHMSELLWKSKFYSDDSYDCYLIKNENEKLLSWAIVAEGEVHFYTRKSERNKGLASKLAKKINKKYSESKLKGDKHDKISRQFLDKYKYKEIYTDE
jgi:hypothetical protein